MSSRSLMLLLSACVGLASCSQQDNKAVTTAPVAPKQQGPGEPFKFHKMIEVSPGQYYDVLSWGRGTKVGAKYLILRSDSTEQKYNTTEGDIDGPIKDVLNSDLDTDGNPEIIIQANSIDTNRYTNVYVYEYRDQRAQKIDWPRLTVSQRKGYRGGDRLFIKDDKLMREFPVYDGSGATAKPNGQKRLLEYSLHSNEFSVKQVSKDSTVNTAKDGVVISQPKVEQKETAKISEKKSSSSKKKTSHKTEKKKKHRHRR
ncbi:hypothetical protein [Mucilaginibacter sp. KACC 22063]|uniref:hypothetical protein n=1 Tax=Mucilaginibacter sp. KACC 22063 TaxID=3025666 RepID=UPI002365B9C2|nr:hypothetical protein [Mucilaginibacter sp. KACC 22063]WDF57086.1 hypothetical protein PQ461_08465 [Mucilaginibacter sp. KACC 22063]